MSTESTASTTDAILREDILYALFEHLAPPDGSWYEYEGPAAPGSPPSPQERELASRRATLAACALVCRAFFRPAASVLWRDLDDFGPVHALFAQSPGQAVPGLTLDSLLRRHRYVSHVRAIHRPKGPLDSAPYLPITQIPTLETPLSLQLTKLRWIQEVPGNLDFLTILSPSLRSLHLIFRHPHPRSCSWREHPRADTNKALVETLLVRAASLAPNLTYLRITRTGGIPESWLVSVCRFAGLEEVHLLEPMYDTVSTAALLQPLAALRYLRVLRMRLPQATDSGAGVGQGIAEGGFAALRELQLNGKFATLQDATALLCAVASPHLRSVRIDNCECPTDVFVDALHEFGTVLKSKFARALEVVDLSVYGIGPAVTLERPLVDYLHPLLQIGGLQDVRLSLAPKAAVVAVSEADVRTMGESWRRLKRLRVDCAPGKSKTGGYGGGLSRRVRERITQDFPLLEDIELPIDGSEDNACVDHVYAGSPPYVLTEPFLCPCLCSA